MAYKAPELITTCAYETAMEGDYWYVYLKSSGTFAFKFSKTNVDVFLQGGGGGGGLSTLAGDFTHGGGGGAGGYQTTQYGQAISGSYTIAIGAGGSPEKNGGTTAAFGFTAEGGEGGNDRSAGKLGTARGGSGGYYRGNGNGSTGDNGSDGKQAFGIGEIFYGAGGGGSQADFAPRSGYGGKTGGGDGCQNGAANTGSGGGGDASGGSGIIILRGTQDDQLPVKFDGVTLQRILYGGQEVMHLIHDGTRIFMEKVREWIGWSKRRMPFAWPAV